MKEKAGLICLMSVILFSCSNEAGVKVDLDSVGKKFDTTAERLYEGAKKELDTLTRKIEDRVNSGKTDTIKSE